jgi:hypothetical protein
MLGGQRGAPQDLEQFMPPRDWASVFVPGRMQPGLSRVGLMRPG